MLIITSFTGELQPLATAVTFKLATTRLSVVFIALKAGMLPLPDAGKPTDTLSFCHEKTVLTILPVKSTRFVFCPAQTV